MWNFTTAFSLLLTFTSARRLGQCLGRDCSDAQVYVQQPSGLGDDISDGWYEKVAAARRQKLNEKMEITLNHMNEIDSNMIIWRDNNKIINDKRTRPKAKVVAEAKVEEAKEALDKKADDFEEEAEKAADRIKGAGALIIAVRDHDTAGIFQAGFDLIATCGPEAMIFSAIGSTVLSFFTNKMDPSVLVLQEIKDMRQEMNAKLDAMSNQIKNGFDALGNKMNTYLHDHDAEITELFEGALIDVELRVEIASKQDVVDGAVKILTDRDNLPSEINKKINQLDEDCRELFNQYKKMQNMLKTLVSFGAERDTQRNMLVDQMVVQTIQSHISLSTAYGVIAQYRDGDARLSALKKSVDSGVNAYKVLDYALNVVQWNYLHDYRLEADVVHEYGAFEHVEVYLHQVSPPESESSPKLIKPFVFVPNVADDKKPIDVIYNEALVPIPQVSKEIADLLEAQGHKNPMENMPLIFKKSDDKEQTWHVPLRYSSDDGAGQVPEGTLRLNSRFVTFVIQPRGFNNEPLIVKDLELKCHQDATNQK